MKKSLLLSAGMFILVSCNTKEYLSYPKGFECFEIRSKRFFVEYTQPVEGYMLKAMWLTKYDNYGDAIILNLDNGEQKYSLRINRNDIMESDILDLGTYKYISKIKNGEVIKLDMTPPIYFYDVDFDEENELLIENIGGWGGRPFYDVYKMNYNSLELMTEFPFTELDAGTHFNREDKSFTNSYSWGNTWYTFFYKQKDYQYMTIEFESIVKKKIELDSVFIDRGDATPVRIHEAYKRKGDRMELVKRDLLIYEKDFDISGNHLKGMFTDTIIVDTIDTSLQYQE